MKMKEITSEELQRIIEKYPDIKIIDVREPEEFEQGHISIAENIPLGEINMYKGDKAISLYIICRSGGRSMQACHLLRSKGYDVINIKDGMLGYDSIS